MKPNHAKKRFFLVFVVISLLFTYNAYANPADTDRNLISIEDVDSYNTNVINVYSASNSNPGNGNGNGNGNGGCKKKC